ncbi:MAG: peptidoglycan DD-metalloendopeptidase family protein [Gammaproteobacteria bacterium]|nr:peptidoglycan DD-metalloendopeptidase family protein [Gammaproteobacteria bacterium]
MRVCVLLLISILLQSCSAPTYAPVSDRRVTTLPGFHKVQRGETLYSIAWMHGIDYKTLARINRIPRPFAIFPKQVLALKSGLKKHTVFKPRPKKKPVVKYKPKKHKHAHKASKKRKQVKKPVIANRKVKRWIWPSKGQLIKRFSSRGSGKKGIAIAGKSGRRIVATAPGKVVYIGEGLVRYGKLIIIKHNNTYLSAYAHNRRILVKEGSNVKQGQQIAEMGQSGTDRVILHFEIRKNGKPVNPLFFLPKRRSR